MLKSSDVSIALAMRRKDLARKVKLMAERHQPTAPGDFHLLRQDILALEALLDEVTELEVNK